MERICQDCGKAFDGRADAQFCSDACRIRTRRKQKPVTSEAANTEAVTMIPAGMVLIDENELAQLRAQAARAEAEIGPEIQIDLSRLSSYLADAKQYVREKHPAYFEQFPTDVDRMLDKVFPSGHRGKIPSMTFTVNVNLAKSALTPD